MKQNPIRVWFLMAAAILFVAFYSAPSHAQSAGEILFRGKCAMCHGPDAAGKTPMGEKLKIPDLRSADVQNKSEADLKGVITKGKDKMPGYETKLTKEQIDTLVVYIRELGKKH